LLLFSFFLTLIFALDVRPSNVMELSVEFGLVIDNIFDIGIEFLRDIFELISPSVFEDVSGLDIITFGHDIGT
jgi:hypothetical protein